MLKRILICLLTGGLLACGIPTTLVPHIQALNTLSEQAQHNIDTIRDRYGLLVTRLNYNDSRLPWQIHSLLSYKPFLPEKEQGLPDAQNQLDSFDKLVSYPSFVTELSKYPLDFFRAQQIDNLYLARELSVGLGPLNLSIKGIGIQWDGKKYPVLTFEGRYLYSYNPDTSGAAPRVETAIEALMPIIHHELFHVIDDHLILGEPSWDRCQPTAEEQQRFYAPQNTTYHPAAGFVTPYAQSIFREDKAEVYRMMMSGTTAQYLEAWITAGDQSLKCKRDWILDYMSTQVPSMNRDYFEAVQLGLGSDTLTTALQQPEALTQLYLKGPNENLSYWSREEIPKELPLPATISRYRNLSELLAEHTKWTSLAPLAQMPQLKKLWLDDQRLPGLPEVILDLPALESLVFHDKLSEIPADLARLKHLKEVSLNLTTLRGTEYLRTQPLERVELIVQEESDWQSLSTLSQVHSLSFKGILKNKVITLNNLPRQLHRLTIINFAIDQYSDNIEDFKTRVASFESLPELTHLRLQGVLIGNLKTALKSLQKLEYLCLSLPELTDFDPDLLDLPKLKTVILTPQQFIHDWNEPTAQAEQKRIQERCLVQGLRCVFNLEPAYYPSEQSGYFGNSSWPFSDFAEPPL
jgi:hypothetical protein